MNDRYRSLCDLSQGETGCVAFLKSREGIRRRLQDIGLIAGTYVERLQTGPTGDPTAFFIRGAVIALREEDASLIYIFDPNPATGGTPHGIDA